MPAYGRVWENALIMSQETEAAMVEILQAILDDDEEGGRAGF